LQPATVAGLTLALAAAAYASTQIVYAEEQASPLPSSKALVIGVIGCPGSGKTTQSRKLAKAFDLTLVEVADERELRRKLAELSSRARARVLMCGARHWSFVLDSMWH
jgi:pantothenate kinase